MDLNIAVENLVQYGVLKLGYEKADVNFARNMILDALGVYDFKVGSADMAFVESQSVPDAIFAPLVDFAKENGKCEEGDEAVFATKLVAIVTPLPSVVQKKFNQILKEEGSEKATDYLFKLSVENYYIQKTMTDKNIYWKTDVKDGNFLEITINLSKPEKNNAEIAKLLSVPPAQNKYPLCPLCAENEGFNGGTAKNPRQTLRTVPIKLDGADWQLQYSPYVYYNHHAIVFSSKHSNMLIEESTFYKLTDFVGMFPHYFIGSNACLPIVGGSILNHEHFQGGGHFFPLHFASVAKQYKLDGFECKIERINWLNSAIRVTGKNQKAVCEVANKIYQSWLGYTDESVGILAETTAKHNALTPIARMIGEEYSIDLILRNNRTSEEHPAGIFHAHSEHHPVKSEGIGLIEAMGLYILPARLKTQLALLSEYLQGKKCDFEGFEIFEVPAKKLAEKFGTALSETEATAVVKEYVEETCRDILKNTAVFKDDEKGVCAFEKFIKNVGIMEV